MNIDMCRLTADVLPLYGEDLLSPETRRALEAHAAGCPGCRRLLAQAAAPGPLPAAPPEPEAAAGPGGPGPGQGQAWGGARRFLLRLRRLLLWGTAALLAVMIGASTLAYQWGRALPADRPLAVASAADLARRVVPGWARAEAHGLLVPLGITERIPDTRATITLEQAWFGRRYTYVLYTVQAPAGEHLMADQALLDVPASGPRGHNPGGSGPPAILWSGFSPAGFHHVVRFSAYTAPVPTDQVQFEVLRWNRVTPRGRGAAHLSVVSIPIPLRDEFLRDVTETFPLSVQHTWLGRTVTLDRLDVGVREARLYGGVQLRPGESRPSLKGRLLFGTEERHFAEQQADPVGGAEADPGGAPDTWRFVITTEPPDNWPAPVRLELESIAFSTDRTLEVEVPWAEYRDRLPRQGYLPADAQDRAPVPFYDGALQLAGFYHDGIAFAIVPPEAPPPHVVMDVFIQPLPGVPGGAELVAPGGQAWAEFGVGGGNFFGDARQAVAVFFGDSLPPFLDGADRFRFRYVQPRARLVLGPWAADLRAAP